MKNYEERFESLEELPITEEMLGAYLEGTLDESEQMYVSEYIDSDEDLMGLSAEVKSYSDYSAEVFPEEDFLLLDESAIVDFDGSYYGGHDDVYASHDTYGMADGGYASFGEQYYDDRQAAALASGYDGGDPSHHDSDIYYDPTHMASDDMTSDHYHGDHDSDHTSEDIDDNSAYDSYYDESGVI